MLHAYIAGPQQKLLLLLPTADVGSFEQCEPIVRGGD
jgi:hypothetical protein